MANDVRIDIKTTADNSELEKLKKEMLAFEEQIKSAGKAAEPLKKEFGELVDSLAKGADVSVVSKQFRDLQKSFDTRQFVNGIDLAKEATDHLGLSFGTTEKMVVGIAGKIPALANAMKALSMNGLLVAVSGIIELFRTIYNLTVGMAKAGEEADRNLSFENARRGFAQIEESSARFNRNLDLTIDKQKSILELEKERVSAAHELEAVELETAKAKELSGVTDERRRGEIERKYEALKNSLDRKSEADASANEITSMDAEIEAMRKRIGRLQGDEKSYRREASANGVKASEMLESASVDGVGGVVRNAGRNILARVGLATSGDDLIAESERYQQLNEQAQKAAEQAQSERLKLEQQLEALMKRRNAAEERQAKLAEAKKRQDETSLAEKEKEAKIAAELARQRFDQAERARRESEEEDETAANRAETDRYAGANDRRRTAEESLARYRAREKEAEDLIAQAREFQRTDGTFTDGGGKTASFWQSQYDDAMQRRSSARSARMGAERSLRDIDAEIRQRKFDEAERQHGIDVEDADFRRSGLYNRLGVSGRLEMDKRRYDEAMKQYAEADAKIKADNDGSKTMTTEERRVAERQRDEARSRITATRESIRDAQLQGDEKMKEMTGAAMKSGSRLAAMGLGGGGSPEKETANNTKLLVGLGKEQLKALRTGNRGGSGGVSWR